jgi:hypothetical protein
MWCWLNANAGGVQAVAAICTLLLTLVLAGITYWYAQLTRSSLKIAKEQFDRQWLPQLGISLEYVPQFHAKLTIHNISNCSLVITGVLLQATDGDRKAISYLVNQPVDAHSKEALNIELQLVDAIRSQSHKDTDQLKVSLGVDYEAMGFIGRVAYLEYAVRIAQSQVVEIVALNVVPKVH